MSQWSVDVWVATVRPPTDEDWSRFRVEADTALEAELLACQWAACKPMVVMPTRSMIVDWPDDTLAR